MAYDKNDNVNTDGLVMYGDDAVLRLDYFNHMVSFKIFPAKPEAERTEKSVYDYSKRTVVSASIDDLVYIGWWIKNVLIPNTKEEKACSIGIITSKVNLIVISNGIKETNKISPYVALFKDLDTSRKPAEQAFFTFRTRRSIINYDPENGEGEVVEDPINGLILLMEFCIQCRNAFGASLQAEKYLDRYANLHRETIMNSIAGKMGINVEQKINYVNRNSKPDVWVNKDNEKDAQVSTATSFDEFSEMI